jgi:hypothetical protein
MFSIKKDENRKYEKGQYYVMLADIDPESHETNRLGYWCDKAHLEHFLPAILNCFTTEEVVEALAKLNARKQD